MSMTKNYLFYTPSFYLWRDGVIYVESTDYSGYNLLINLGLKSLKVKYIGTDDKNKDFFLVFVTFNRKERVKIEQGLKSVHYHFLFTYGLEYMDFVDSFKDVFGEFDQEQEK